MIDLMMYVIFPASVLLAICLFGAYRLRARAQLKKQDRIAKKINDTKAAFKATLEMFSMQRIIRPVHVKNFYGIVNNYFVNQEINEENAKNLEKLANRIAITISKEANLTKSDADIEWLQKKLLNFALMLPAQTKAYNKTFYQSRIKQLLRGLACTKSSFIQRYSQAQAA